MPSLKDIKIMSRPDYDRPKNRGDFDVYIYKDMSAMLVPANLFNLIIVECNANNVQTAMEYLSVRSQTVARLLGWTDAEAKAAFQKLVAYVHGALNMPQSTTQRKRR